MAGDKIFISYRRSGSPKDAHMIFDHLVKVLGAERVFMDVDGIAPGDDFVEVLERQLDDCAILLALIGPDWLQARDDHGQRKLDNDEDFVRVEIRTALGRQLRVIPILLDGTPMPRKEDLPKDLHLLTRRQGLPVDARDFHGYRNALARLVQVLHSTPPTPPAPMNSPPAQAPTRRPLVEAPVANAPVIPAGPQAPSLIVSPSRLQPWMSDAGKDEHGHWADLTVKRVVQRMRWIEPGEFWMGSPQAERDAIQSDVVRQWANERESEPRMVRVEQGFWLADTPCTQAAWMQVADGFKNPSKFQSGARADLRPMEQVSWDHVQLWIYRLGKLLPHVRGLVGLPTEVQWEYAARAGTRSAYWWGDAFDESKANVDLKGDRGSNGKRGATTPVKGYSANPWGLYDMHGNVWEWCEDAWREWLIQEGGRGDPSKRAVRGGSWFNDPDQARSAYRERGPLDEGASTTGFRFSLRSSVLAPVSK